MLRSACDARIWPIGAASGGHPDSARIWTTSVEGVEQPVAGRVGPEVDVEGSDEAGRQVVLGRADRNSRRHGSDGLVADVLVDQVGRLPQRSRVDAGITPQPLECVDERLSRDPVQCERERVDGGRDQVGPDPRCDDGVEQPRPRRSLHEQPHRQARFGPDPLHELLGQMWQQRVRRIVEDDAGRAELGNLLRPLDQRFDLAFPAGAVDEPDVELLPRGHDGLPGLTEVRDVVERIVEAKDVDAVVGGTGDEPAHDVRRDGARADEEPPAKRQAERRRRPRIDRPDPLPRALDGSPDGRVEYAASRDLEVGEPRTVEDLRDPQHLAGGQLARERLLRQQTDRGVDDFRHSGWDLIVALGVRRRRPAAGQAREM